MMKTGTVLVLVGAVAVVGVVVVATSKRAQAARPSGSLGSSGSSGSGSSGGGLLSSWLPSWSGLQSLWSSIGSTGSVSGDAFLGGADSGDTQTLGDLVPA